VKGRLLRRGLALTGTDWPNYRGLFVTREYAAIFASRRLSNDLRRDCNGSAGRWRWWLPTSRRAAPHWLIRRKRFGAE